MKWHGPRNTGGIIWNHIDGKHVLKWVLVGKVVIGRLADMSTHAGDHKIHMLTVLSGILAPRN